MNIYDIAKQAEVSIATVSRVINNSGYVGKKTREKIIKIIDESNYIPNSIAQNLSNNTSFKMIGLVCYNIEDLYYAKAVAILEKNLKSFGYDIILTCTSESLEQKNKSVNMLLSKNVDAIIFIGSVFAGESCEIIKKTSKYVPVFIINALIEGDNIFSCYCNDLEAVKTAVTDLILTGRQNILYMYDANTYGGQKKIEGYKQAIQINKLKITDNYIIKCNYTLESAENTFLEFIKTNKVDAVVCSNDLIAAGVLIATKSLNLTIPKQLAIIGHNNSMITKCTSPQLTSIDNGVEKLSVFTAENLSNYFKGKETKKVFEIPFQIKRRESF